MGELIDVFKVICMSSYLVISGSWIIILFIKSLVNSELDSSIIFLVLSLGVIFLWSELYNEERRIKNS